MKLDNFMHKVHNTKKKTEITNRRLKNTEQFIINTASKNLYTIEIIEYSNLVIL